MDSAAKNDRSSGEQSPGNLDRLPSGSSESSRRNRQTSSRHPSVVAAEILAEAASTNPRLDRHFRKVVTRVTVAYLLLGATWILVSDEVAAALWTDRASLAAAQHWKGWFFVAASAFLIYVLLSTSLKRAGQLVREKAEIRRQLHVLADNLPGMVYRCVNDVDWTMDYVSKGSTEVTGYAPDELLGPHATAYSSLVLPSDVEEVRRKIEIALKDGSSFEVSYRIIDKQGEVRWVWERGRATAALPGQPAVLEGVIFDETERMDLQDRLRQSARMRVIGQLSAGAAHDFNNVLSVVRGQAQMGLNEVAINGPAARRLMGILHAANKGTSLARQLLLFSHRRDGPDELISVADAMNGVRQLLERAIDDRHQVIFNVGEDPGCLRGDRSMLDQIVVNLVMNAVDALPDGGEITVGVDRVELTKEEASKLRLCPSPGAYRVITVRDKGVGIPPKLADRIFEPFFSTKKGGHGAGIGLYSVITSVERFGGGMSVQSTEGQGSTFRVYLPEASAEQVAELKSEKVTSRQAGVPLIRGSGTVLLVEDSHMVREVAAEYLKDCGYNVMEAVSVSDALQRAEASPYAIDLAVVDVVLPGMTGERLVELLRVFHPNLRRLYMSGHTAEYLRNIGIKIPPNEVMPKPIALEDLGTRVRELAKPPATMSQRLAKMVFSR